jgi:hypothetical protein
LKHTYRFARIRHHLIGVGQMPAPLVAPAVKKNAAARLTGARLSTYDSAKSKQGSLLGWSSDAIYRRKFVRTSTAAAVAFSMPGLARSENFTTWQSPIA